jgi:hypothetical protein
MTRRCLLLLALTLCFVLGAAASAAANTVNTFITVCSLVQNPAEPWPEDPISFPDQPPPVGPNNEFFGNTGARFDSTGFSLLADGNATHTTCRDRFDTAAYWVPTLYQDGVRLAPRGLDAYYQRLAGVPSVVAPPTNFRLIAGNDAATAPQDRTKVEWHCMGQQGTFQKAPPACSGQLGLDIRFPSCWDGSMNLQANHTNNAVYETGAGSCPRGFTTAVPKILLTIHYPGASKPDCHLVRSPMDGVNCYVYTLSEYVNGQTDDQGSIYGQQADFLNGWNTTLDTTDPSPLDFASLIQRFDNAPNGTPGCDNTCTQTNPTGDSFLPIYP